MPLRDRHGSIVGIFGISRDITKRKLAEERADYHLRLYDTLSKINRAIVYAGQRGELFDKICEIIVVAGKFERRGSASWTRAGECSIEWPRAGQESDPSRSDADIYGVKAQARSPIGTAIRTGRVVLYEDPANPDQAERRTTDHRSSAAIPFGVKGAGIGVLNISATDTGYFTQEERWMLEEIGADISFALEKMNLEIERKRPDEDKAEEANTRY